MSFKKIELPKEKKKPSLLLRKAQGLFGDFLALAAIIAVGFFLIGWYLQGEFLATGYQDWIYQAYRVEHLRTFGISSWNSAWSNGTSMWRAYPFWLHGITAAFSQLTQFSTTKAMLTITAIIFILIRVFLYFLLRLNHVNKTASLVGVILSFGFAQQWYAIKEYLLFGSLIFAPFVILIWKKSLENKRWLYLFSAVSGFLFTIEPSFGYSMSVLWLMTVFFILKKRLNMKEVFSSIVFYTTGLLPFFIPHFFYGYSFINPIHTSSQFVRDALVADNLGLSLPYLFLFGISWFAFLFYSIKIPVWVKYLLLYSSLLLAFISFGLKGAYPDFINELQFSRALPLVGILLPLCFSFAIHTLQKNVPSRFLLTICLILTAIFIVDAVGISEHSAQPVRGITNPVSIFFESSEKPKGSVFYTNVAEASYFTESDIRYSTSHVGHLEQHPLSQRLRNLLSHNLSYTGVSLASLEAIETYTDLLGVEYLFLSDVTPIANDLSSSSSASFEKLDTTIHSTSDTFAVLKNKSLHTGAFLSASSEAREKINFKKLKTPTLDTSSWDEWDTNVLETLSALSSQTFSPIDINYTQPNKIEVQWGNEEKPKYLFVNQSYDSNWRSNIPGVKIEPTSLRFIFITLPDSLSETSLELTHSWPRYHWLLYAISLGSIIVTFLYAIVPSFKRKHD